MLYYGVRSIQRGETNAMAVTQVEPPAYREIIELLAGGPTPQQILDFQPSDEAQQRVRELLGKNQNGTLKPQEEAELEHYTHIEHLMRLVKARARTYLQT